MKKEKLYPTDEEMRRHFEKLVPEEMRSELFDILTIDYMTELQMAAKFAVDNCVRKIVEWMDTLEFHNDWGGESGKNTVEFIQANLKELIK